MLYLKKHLFRQRCTVIYIFDAQSEDDERLHWTCLWLSLTVRVWLHFYNYPTYVCSMDGRNADLSDAMNRTFLALFCIDVLAT